jgi:hypothetical protein
VFVAGSREEVREVGTGGSFVGKLGATVRAGADGVAVVFTVLGGVLVVVAARGALFANARAVGEEEKLRYGNLYARGVDLDDERTMDSPLRARGAAIIACNGQVHAVDGDYTRYGETRSHDQAKSVVANGRSASVDYPRGVLCA